MSKALKILSILAVVITIAGGLYQIIDYYKKWKNEKKD